MSTPRIDQINADLQAFRSHPIQFMNRLPRKYDRHGNPLAVSSALFDSAAIYGRRYVEARDSLRQDLTRLDEIAPAREAFGENDRADRLVDTYSYSGLQAMETQGLMSSTLPASPWSDDYWALYLGVLGKRYADASFPGSGDWKVNNDYIKANPAATILESGDAAAINLLSPSEKYDALIGDANRSLTKRMWEEGRRYYVKYGHVEGWMGICHGWAPAAYMLPRPTETVQVRAPDGTAITFFPSDIKALASLLWAKIRYPSRFIGGRCNIESPETDPVSGRIKPQPCYDRYGNYLGDKCCFDTNPGTWHLAAVNQIGVSHRSMVMDVTYDYQVWNQPVLSYEYTYLNPKTRTSVNSLAEATVLKADFDNDLFASYRSSDTYSIAGIAMDVSYLVETSPSHDPVDSASDDCVHMVRYLYDLELDIVGNIIGGEWYENAHPDFLWTPEKDREPLTYWEIHYPSIFSADWDKGQPLPQLWQRIAAATADSYRAPLAAIVKKLIEFSNA